MPSPTDDVLDRLRDLAPAGFQIPPPVFTEMRAAVVAFDEGAAGTGAVLRVRFPVEERFANPAGVMQGGMIAAAIDNTIGPLSYLVAPPSVTTQLNVSYLRPIPPALGHFEVEGRFDERTRQYLFFSARVTDPKGRVLVLAQATCLVLPRRTERD